MIPGRPSSGPGPDRTLDARLWWGALALLLVLAAALRLGALDRYPPGLHYDEAAYGLQALELSEHPRLQVFFPAYTGREPLFIYLLAAGVELLGASVWSIRAVAAAVGVLAVATTALAGRALFGPAVGLLGAALLATSFWHVAISRMTYRAGLVAALTPLAIWLLWRLWRAPGARRAILAGLALGLLAYTYVAIRLLPVALALFALGELVAGPLRDRRRLAAAALAAAVALAVAAPLGLYFLRHPADFGVRFAQTVSLGAGDETPAAPLLRGVAATLAMYGQRGDALAKYNLPLRPALDPALAALFWLGAATLLARIGRAESRLTLAWLAGALAPGFLTADSPNFLRLVGAAPPSYLIAAVGAAQAAALAARWGAGRVPGLPARRPGADPADRAAPRQPPAGRSGWLVLAALALVAVEGGLTARDYWRWGRSAETYYALHGDLADLGRMAAAAPPAAAAYVASEHFRHPTVAFTAGAAFERLRWFDGREALVLPPPGTTAEYLIPASARPPDLAPLDAPIERRSDPDGRPAVERARSRADAAPTGAGAVVFARRGGPPLAELLAVEPPPAARAGQTVPVRTAWRLLADAPSGSLDLFVHAVDAGGRRWGQRDASPYLTGQWRRGETLIAWLALPLDPTAPPGPYRLRVGLNDPAAPGLVEARRPDGQPLGADLLLAPFPVGHAPDRVPAPAGLAPVDLGPVALLAEPPPHRLTVGQLTWVDLLWRAAVDSPAGAAELRLRPEAGGADRPLDRRELAELDPTAPWRAGETIRDARRLRPRPADAGRWSLVARLGDREAVLGPVEVVLPPALFDPPRPQVAADDELGGVGRLLGLDLTPVGVRLYWRAREPSETPLVVFVHALGPDGRIVAQHDGSPAGGGRPTTGWIPDEVVADEHPLALPADWTALAVGMYDPATGQRLSLPGGGDAVRVPRPG